MNTYHHHRRRRITAIPGTEIISADVHDQPAVRRRVGVDSYRAQTPPESIAAAILSAVQPTADERRTARLERIVQLIADLRDECEADGARLMVGIHSADGLARAALATGVATRTDFTFADEPCTSVSLGQTVFFARGKL